MVNSRRKGHDAELKVAGMLHRHTGETFTQTPGSGSGKVKGDLMVPHKHNLFTIEVKHYIDNTSSGYSNYVATCKNNQTKYINSILKPNLNVNILIGPEGDFSHDELVYAKNANFTPVSFSNKRLRSETAAIYFCTLFSYINKL